MFNPFKPETPGNILGWDDQALEAIRAASKHE
jgi:hypothetical protein